MPAVALPFIIGGIGAGATAYGAYKQGQALDSATANSNQIAAAQVNLANRQQQMGERLTNLGLPMTSAAAGYYSTLLRGDRSQMRLATAGPRAAITDQYRGAEKSLERNNVNGGVRDLAKAELSRDRAGAISRLTTGVQPGAAASLADIGSSLTSGGATRLSGAESGLSGAASTYGGVMGSLAGRPSGGAAVGNFLFDILNGIPKRQSSVLPSSSMGVPNIGFLPNMSPSGGMA